MVGGGLIAIAHQLCMVNHNRVEGALTPPPPQQKVKYLIAAGKIRLYMHQINNLKMDVEKQYNPLTYEQNSAHHTKTMVQLSISEMSLIFRDVPTIVSISETHVVRSICCNSYLSALSYVR